MELVCIVVISTLSSLLGLCLMLVAGYFVKKKCQQVKLQRQKTINSGMVTIGRRRTTKRQTVNKYCHPKNNNPYPNLNQRNNQQTRPNLYACHPSTPSNAIPVIRIAHDDDFLSVNSSLTSTYANIKRNDISQVSGEYANCDESEVPSNSKQTFPNVQNEPVYISPVPSNSKQTFPNVQNEPVYISPVIPSQHSNNMSDPQAVVPILGMRSRLASAIRSIPNRLSTNVFSFASTPANSPHSSHSSHSQEEEGAYLSFQGNSRVNLTPKI